ncbi:MAG TPA: GGDEF domain-containing protein [Candidatus Elarobacter sp.]
MVYRTHDSGVVAPTESSALIARRVYAFVRAASLLAAVVLTAVWGPGAARALRPDDVLFLVAALAVTVALGWLRTPAAHFERSVRPTPDSDRVGLLTPLLIAVLAHEGWFWAAWCALIAQLVRPHGLRRRPFPERAVTAALRFPALLAGGLIAEPLHRAAAAPPSPAALAVFVGIAGAYVIAVDLLWLDPLMALRQTRSLLRVWRRHLADGATALTIVAETAWAYVVAHVALAEGAFVGAAALVPLIVLGAVLVRLARVNARLHRLALSRQAVDAMLRATDPQPQLRSLLESIDPRIVRESVEIAAFGRRGPDRWSRLMRFGEEVPGDLERLGGRALLEVQVTAADALVESDEHGSVHAYAARDAQGGLRGAIVVFRTPDATALVASRDLERAAAEIGPLLGEYGAIAATRTAASIDTLTGLPNRRGVGRALDDAMAHVRGGGRYAVLLLDVDHFKSINDLLGHQSGDRALAQIGRVIAENIRGVDVAGRFGGEEFLVLLRDASRDRALQVAERLRGAIETGGVAYADGKPVTVSVGVAYARAADGTGDVVERADRALYRAKNAGRNRVVESPLVAV